MKLRSAIFLLAMLLPATAHAQVVPPANALIATIPGINQTIGIWATDSPVGGYVALYMQNGGVWAGCQDCYIAPSAPDFNFDATVAGAGGPAAYVRNVVVPAANALLARKFPAGGGNTPPPPTANATTQINFLLGTTCSLGNASGVETLSCH